MATKPTWPDPAASSLLGRRISRIEGPAKTRGAVKYTYDQKRPGMLWGAVARCPHARADLVAESAALAWKLFRDGHPAARSPADLARHAVALARAGHTLAGD